MKKLHIAIENFQNYQLDSSYYVDFLVVKVHIVDFKNSGTGFLKFKTISHFIIYLDTLR